MKLRALLVLAATALVAVVSQAAGLGDDGLHNHAMGARTDSMATAPRATATAPAPVVAITALPWTRQVTCTGSVVITGTATNATGIGWSTSPSGDSGGCTGTSSWSCTVAVSPNAVGEGVETVVIAATGAGGSDTEQVDVGFYVAGAHSCFLAQNYDAAFNAGKADATAVATWENLGSSALDVVNATGTQQPAYRTAVKNGQPTIRFDGSNDNLKASTASDWIFLHSGVDQTVEVTYAVTDANPNQICGLVATVAVLSSGASRGISVFYDDRAASTREDQQRYAVSSGAALNVAFGSADDEVPAQTFNATASMIDDDGGAGADGFIYTNNVLSASAVRANAYSSADPVGPLTLGAETDVGSPFKGDFWRITIYSSALSSTQRGINKAVDEWALGGSFPLALGTPVTPPAPDELRWAFVGDSITAGALGVTRYPDKLAAYAPGVTFAVDATGGDKTFEILNSWRDVIVAGTPGKVFVLGGINNIRTDQTAGQAFHYLDRIYGEAQALGTQVVAMQPLPFGDDAAWTAARQTQLEALMPLIAADADVDVLVDFYTLMGEPGTPVNLATIYDSSDGLHPNEAGTQFMADEVANALGL